MNVKWKQKHVIEDGVEQTIGNYYIALNMERDFTHV